MNRSQHSMRAFEMPDWRLSLRRRQILEGTRVAQWEQKSAQDELSSVQAHWFRQMSIFRHFVHAFCVFITSDQTYCRGSQCCVAANPADGLSSASTHDSTSDEVCDIFSKPSASSLHLMKHIHTGVQATL